MREVPITQIHIYFTEFLKSKVYQKKGNIDSAYYYSKKAFFGLPNNTLHSANFVKLAMQKKDLVSIEKAADQLIEITIFIKLAKYNYSLYRY